MLIKHWTKIKAVEASEVIVPLCGKSLDMLWLAEQGYSVIGLEMVEEAVKAFFEENSLPYVSEKTAAHTKHSSQNFTVYQGNVFDLEAGTLNADAW